MSYLPPSRYGPDHAIVLGALRFWIERKPPGHKGHFYYAEVQLALDRLGMLAERMREVDRTGEKTYPSEHVDRMIDDLRDMFMVRPMGVMTRQDFEERVLAFKDEIAGGG